MRKALRIIKISLYTLAMLESLAHACNDDPQAIIAGGDRTVQPGTEVVFNGSESYDYINGPALVWYTWNFDDGTPEISGRDAKIVTHTFTVCGEYHVTLTVRDTGAKPEYSGLDTTTVKVTVSSVAGTKWYVKANGGDDTANGHSWDTAFKSLQRGISLAAPGDEVYVAAGVYTPEPVNTNPRLTTFINGQGVSIYGGFAGNENSPDDRKIESNPTILSGDLGSNDRPPTYDISENCYRVLSLDGLTLIDGFTIEGGNANATGHDNGGAFRNSLDTTFANCTFRNNYARYGGAVSIIGHCTFINCVFENNHATATDGGAIQASGGATIELTNCTFRQNTAYSGRGGAVYVSEVCSAITNCVFDRNAAVRGGGMMARDCSSTTLRNCSFSRNESSLQGGYDGAGFRNAQSTDCQAWITNCIFWGNRCTVDTDNQTDDQIMAMQVDSYASDIVTFSHNCIEKGSENSFGGSGNTSADPCFVNASGGNVHLRVDSPCVDEGLDAYVAGIDTDRDGNPRIFDRPGRGDAEHEVDMGAYENSPILHDDYAVTYRGQAVDISVLDNDENLDGLSLSVVCYEPGATVLHPNIIRYTPTNSTFVGRKSFSCSVGNELYGSWPATVTVDVLDTAVEAGDYEPVTWPINSIRLNGQILGTPPLGSTVEWLIVYSDQGCVLGLDHSISLTEAEVNFASPGICVVRLRLMNGDTEIVHDDAVLQVLPNATYNTGPIIETDFDRSFVRGTEKPLAGSVTDDGHPAGMIMGRVTVVGLPQGATAADVTLTNSEFSGETRHLAIPTKASFSKSGTYVLRFWATDGQSESSLCSTVQITGNLAPRVEAGTDRTVMLVSNGKISTDDASVDDADSPSVTKTWSQVDGPSGQIATFGNPAAVITTVSFQGAGKYVLRLTADDGVSVVYDDVVITVRRPILYLGGSFYDAGAGEDRAIAYRHTGGSSLERITPSPNPAVPDCIANDTWLWSLCEYHGELFALTENAIYKYQGGTSWSKISAGGSDSRRLVVYRNKLYDGLSSIEYDSGTGNWVRTNGPSAWLYRPPYTSSNNSFGYIGGLYVWNGLLYLSDREWTQFAHYDGKYAYFDVSVGGSCGFDFSDLGDTLYAGAHEGTVWSSSNGVDWAYETTLNPDYEVEEIEAFKGCVYACTGGSLLRYDPFLASTTDLSITGLTSLSLLSVRDTLVIAGLDSDGKVAVYADDGFSAPVPVTGSTEVCDSVNALVQSRPALLHLAQSDGLTIGSTVKDGDVFTYNIECGPNANAVTSVVLTDILPTGVDYVGATDGGRYDASLHRVQWHFGDWTATAGVQTVHITVRVNSRSESGGYLINGCQLESDSTSNYVEGRRAVSSTEQRIIYVDSKAIGYNSGTSWEDAYTDLNSALRRAASALSGCEQIWVAAGRYSPGQGCEDTFQLVPGVKVLGGFTSDKRDPADLNLTRGRYGDGAILDGRRGWIYVDNVVTGADGAVLDGFTVTNGRASGIYCNGTAPIIRNCAVTGSGFGCSWRPNGNAAIYCTTEGTSPFKKPVIADCRIFANSNGVLSDTHSCPVLINNVIRDNGTGLSASLTDNTTERVKAYNCSIMHNSTNIYCNHGNDLAIYNCIDYAGKDASYDPCTRVNSCRDKDGCTPAFADTYPRFGATCHWWKMDSITGGNTLVDSVGAFYGTAIGGGSLDTPYLYKYTGFKYTESSYVSLPANPVNLSEPFTASAWVYIEPEGGCFNVFSFVSDVNDGFVLQLKMSNNEFVVPEVRLGRAGTDIIRGQTFPSIPHGQWVHIAYVSEGSSGWLYVNGEDSAAWYLPLTGQWASKLDYPLPPEYSIGHFVSTSTGVDYVTLRDVLVHQKALTSTEVSQLYQAEIDNYRLTALSSCRDTGLDNAITGILGVNYLVGKDIDGNVRLIGDYVDIGAAEFVLVSAGPDLTVTLHDLPLELTGAEKSDSVDHVSWTLPTDCYFDTASYATDIHPNVRFYKPGPYTLTFTGYKGDNSEIASDFVHIQVNPWAGEDLTAVVGQPVTLTGEIGAAGSAKWVQVSGPPAIHFVGDTTDSSEQPAVTFGALGDYEMELRAYDGDVLLGSDRVQINCNLLVEAGETISCDKNETITLDKAMVWCGVLFSCQWTVTPDVPGSVVWTSMDTLNPQLYFTTEGPYSLCLTVTATIDDIEITASDNILVKVGSSFSPVVCAGADKTITSAQMSAYLSDSWVFKGDADTISWSILCRPAGSHAGFINGSNIVSTSSALHPMVTFVSPDDRTPASVVTGPYVLRLSLTSGSNTIYDDVTIDVQENDNTDPVITSFTATADGLPINAATGTVNGLLEARAVAEDQDMASIKFYLVRQGFSDVELPSTAKILDGTSMQIRKMRATFSLHSCFIAEGICSLKVVACDKNGRQDEATTDTFNIVHSSTPDAAEPYAAINGWGYRSKGMSLLSQAIEEGCVELSCQGYSVPDGNIQYKLELFGKGIENYEVDYWESGYDIYDKYFVKNVTPVPVADRGTLVDGFVVGIQSISSPLTLDLTGVENGSYLLALTVQCGSVPNVKCARVYIPITLACQLKIGNLKFSQEDIVIPAGGFPLQVVRTYNSLEKSKDGDFGYGWTYSIANMQIDLNEQRQVLQAEDGSWHSVRAGSDYDRDVTMTLPDGQRVTFRCGLQVVTNSSGNPYAPDSYRAVFTAPYGVSATLTTERNEIRDPMGFWSGDWGTTGAVARAETYDFSGFVLTLEDGTEYHIVRDGSDTQMLFTDSAGTGQFYAAPRGKPYLAYILMPTGEKILFDTQPDASMNRKVVGVRRYLPGTPEVFAGAMAIERQNGRITTVYSPSETEIVQPDGVAKPRSGAVASVKYSYDLDGNLQTVSRLKTRATLEYETIAYKYEETIPEDPQTHAPYLQCEPGDHRITAISDARGIDVVKYHYDTAGRLIAMEDASNGQIKIDHDQLGTEKVRDRMGVWSEYAYDNRGRVLSETKGGKTTSYVYVGYELHYTEGMMTYDGETYSNTYTTGKYIGHERDKPCKVTGPDNGVTYYQYDDAGRIKKTIDPEMNATSNEYDPDTGNLLSSTQLKLRRNSSGGIELDVNNKLAFDELTTSRNYYTPNGLVYFSGTTTGPTDALVWHSANRTCYDDNGRIRHTININLDAGTGVSEFFNLVYNPSNDTIRYNYAADHSVTSYEYFSNLPDQPSSVTDPAGATTYFHYNANGAQDASWYNWDDPATTVVDYRHIVTVNDLDCQGRAIRTRRITGDGSLTSVPPGYLDGTNGTGVVLSSTIYNSIGKVDYSIDENKNLTKYEYDEVGNVTETRTYNIGTIGFDETAAIATYIANFAHILTVSQTLYDAEGRAVVSVGPYDPAVYLQDMTRWPVGTETVYDTLGRVEQTRRWPGVTIFLSNLPGGVGKTASVAPANAWNGTGAMPIDICWKSNDKLPVARQLLVGETQLPSTQQGPLSYSRSIYDAAGRVEHSITLDENGVEQPTSYKYDAAGKQTTVIDPLGHNLTYNQGIALGDGTHSASTITFPAPDWKTCLNNSHQTKTIYDGQQRDSVTDARGNATSFGYDDAGRLIHTKYPQAPYVTGFDAGGAPVTTTGPTYTHVTYDGLGRKRFESEQTTIANPDSPDVIGKTFEYDTSGRLTKVTLPAVDDPEDSSSDLVNPVYRYFYDTHGNQIGIIDPKLRLTVFAYDEQNRQIRQYMPFVPPSSIHWAWEILALDLTGISFQSSEYDVFSRLETSTDYKGQFTVYSYDPQGRLEFKRHYANVGAYAFQNPSANADPEIRYTYDNLGRRDGVYVNAVLSEDYDYTVEGNLSDITYAGVGAVHYEYDPITGQKKRTKADGGAVTDTQSTYDELGRLRTVQGKADVPPAQAEYTYDAAGSRDSLKYANGNFAQHSYDQLSRLTGITNYQTKPVISQPTPPVLSSFAYSLAANGRRSHVVETDQAGQQTALAWTYDNLGRLQNETCRQVTSPANLHYQQAYTYDLAGNRTGRVVSTYNSSPVKTGEIVTTYSYYPGTDRLHEEINDQTLICRAKNPDGTVYACAIGGQINYFGNDGSKISSFKAWLLGMPTKWSRYSFWSLIALIPILPMLPLLLSRFAGSRQETPWSIAWRRCVLILLAWCILIGPGVSDVLAVDSSLYTGLCASAWGTDNTTIVYQYDANGSVTEKKTITTGSVPENVLYRTAYIYDLAGRLAETQEQSPGGTTVVSWTKYSYNDEGIRIKAEYSSGVIKTFLVDPANGTGYAQVLEEWDGTTRTSYVIGDDVLAQKAGDSAMQYLLYDGHGSTRQIADTAGSVTDSYSYDAYGMAVGFNPATASTKLLYSGEQYDNSLSQYYLRARYYDPSNGRFTQTDPFAGNTSDPQSLHKYTYCHNDPINGVDPSGETYVQVLVASAVIGFMMGAVLGAIRTGTVMGALKAGFIGAAAAPLMTMGVTAAGLGIAAAFGLSTTTGLAIAFGVTTAGSMAWNTYDYLTAKNDKDRLAAGVSMVFTAGFAVFGAYQFGKIPSLPSNARSGTVLPNSKGALGEFLSEAAALLRGERTVARQVTIETRTGLKVRVDSIVRTLTGKLNIVESKCGPASTLKTNQRAGYLDIMQSGGTVKGDSGLAGGLPAGTVLGPTDVRLDTWNGSLTHF